MKRRRIRIIAIALLGAFQIVASWASDFTVADKALRSGDYSAALAALKAQPTESRADLYGLLLRQGEIALGTGNPQLAEEIFEKASFQMPTATEAQAGLIRALLAQGRFKEASTEARRALQEAPENAQLIVAVAQLENHSGNMEAALSRLGKAQSSATHRLLTDAHLLRMAQADILIERGRYADARKALKDWLAHHPQDADALDALGQVEYALGNTVEGSRLRAAAAIRFHTQGDEMKAAAIQEWMSAMNLYAPPPAAPAPPRVTEATAPPPTETTPSPRQQEQPTPTPTSPATPRPPPRTLPEAKFESIRVPQGVSIKTGSGFVIDDGERVVTNAHVIGTAKQLTVRNGIGKVRKVWVEAVNKEDDLAVLRLETAYPGAWAIPRDRIEEPRPGRSCFVLGYPLSGTLGTTWPALTSGLISRTDGGMGGYMQITASLNSGNSGGPVVDDQGRLIGIVVAKLDTLKYAEKHGQMPEDVNFAIRPSLLMRLLNTLQQKVSESSPGLARMDAESVYELMLPSVVLVVAPQTGAN
jgi:S1-C subfamily serine protease